jgi:serine/threonine protein phosphatase PrpC
MQQTVVSAMGWRIESWEQPSGSNASQDAKLVWPDPSGRFTRLAVVDGVTPSAACRTVAGVDGAMFAAAIAVLALQHPGRGLEECALAANGVLHDERLARSRDQMQTCVTAADVFADGRIEVLRAGDCEAWARTADGWVALGCGTALTEHTEAAWNHWQRRNPAVDRATRHDAEERLLGRKEAWTSTALGRFAHPTLQSYTVHGARELVLASDGARLSEEVLEDLPEWLGGLRGWERSRSQLRVAAGKVHDDVSVLRLLPAPIALPFAFGAAPAADADVSRRAS